MNANLMITDELELGLAESSDKEEVVLRGNSPYRFFGEKMELCESANILGLVIVGGLEVDVFATMLGAFGGVFPERNKLSVEIAHRLRSVVSVVAHSNIL